MNGGWLTLFRWRGTPVRAHWSVPLGAWALSGFRIDPIGWFAMILVILVHEFGHAVVVRACRQRVLAIDVHGFGGLCRWQGHATPIQRAAIAWGGVWAQMILLACAFAYFAWRIPESHAEASFERAFIEGNLWIIALNLLPFPPLDGSEAWALPGLLLRRTIKRWRARRFEAKTRVRRPARASGAVVIGIDTARRARSVDPHLDEEMARIERVDAAAREVRPEVDELLGRIGGLRRVDEESSRPRVRAGTKKTN